MIRRGPLALKSKSQNSGLGSRSRRGRRRWELEGLEGRVLLSATVYTVTDTSGNAADTGSLPYAVSEANRNTNKAGSIINFDGDVFNSSSPGLIYLSGTLDLTNTAGPEMIEGAAVVAGAGNVQIDGNQSYVPFEIIEGVTATISGVTIQNGVNADGLGGGIRDLGNLTVTNTTITGCIAQASGATYGGTNGGQGGGIYAEGTLVVNGCTLSNDQATDGNQSAGEGGGIYVAADETVSVTDSTVTSDHASLGGGIYGDAVDDPSINGFAGMLTVSGGTISDCTGGGICTEGNADIAGVTVTGNTAETTNFSGAAYCGGISNVDGSATLTGDTIEKNSAEYGCGISNSGAMTISTSTIANNSAAGTVFGGGIYNTGTLTVESSTIAGNSVGGSGGGIYDTVGVAAAYELTLIDSTIAKNQASQGGGICMAGAPMQAINCTIAYNTAETPGSGGGLDVTADYSLPVLDNTIIALNKDSAGADDITGMVAAVSEYNLVGTGGSGGMINDNPLNNIVSVANPGLGGLTSNGGPTETIVLAFESPAVGAGNVALATDPTNNSEPLPFDQRGSGFPATVNGKVNIGSVENIPTNPILHNAFIYWGVDGQAVVQPVLHGLDEMLLPAGRKNDVPWIGIDSFGINLTEPAVLTAGDVTVQSARGINYGPITVMGSGMSYMIMLGQKVEKADRLTITVNIGGTEIIAAQLDVLPGDVNGDGVVNGADVTALKRVERGKGTAQSMIFGDLLGDGAISASDLAAIKKYRGTMLPRLAVKHPKAVLARALARRSLDRKRR